MIVKNKNLCHIYRDANTLEQHRRPCLTCLPAFVVKLPHVAKKCDYLWKYIFKRKFVLILEEVLISTLTETLGLQKTFLISHGINNVLSRLVVSTTLKRFPFPLVEKKNYI